MSASAPCSPPMLGWSHHWWSLRRFLISCCGCTLSGSTHDIKSSTSVVEYPAALVLLLTESLLPWTNPTGSHRSRRPPAPGWLPSCLLPRVGGETSGNQHQGFHLSLHRPYAESCLAETQLYCLSISVLWGTNFHRLHRPQPPSTWITSFRTDTPYLSPLNLHMLSISSVCNKKTTWDR